MSMEKIREEAKKYFGDVNPAHDWKHVRRVENLAEKLAEREEADEEVVKASVLLHDIGRKKEDEGEIENHAEWGAEEAKKILEGLGYREGFIEEVQHCVRSHRYSKDPEPETVEAQVLSDADNLDALGATGIARTFTYGGEHGRVIADPELPADEDPEEAGSNSFNHLQKKILNLKERMYTSSGLEVAEERHEYVKAFVERFKDEMHGEK
ncbi:MAG: HD domain-containing protein [Candidatus Nanohalobium sp.]